MNSALVTGANGFVGTELCKELSKNGVNVFAIVRNENSDVSRLKEIENVKIIYCDLDRINELPNLIKEKNIDSFYHLAWQGASGIQRGDVNVQIKNIKATCEAVKISDFFGCKKFIYAASIMEYEINSLMSKTISPGISSIYSTAKMTADYMAKAIASENDVDYIRVIISNIYGPGEFSARLINSSIRKMLKKEHCSFSLGEQMYDFIYITDAARAFYLLGDRGKNNKTYYLGSNKPRPLKEFLCEMRDVIDKDISLGLGEIPFNGVSLTYEEFDRSMLFKDTGFIPEIPFDEGIKLTAQWIEEEDR